ncbi:MAG: DUF3788 family protein [Planctomycetota bacterium]
MNGNGKNSKDGSRHPFARKDPKPTRARLVSLLDPLGRKRYGEVERFLATVTGATSGLFYYGAKWGWAVRYLLGTKNPLCTLHLLPNTFEATVALGKEMDGSLNGPDCPQELKRWLARHKGQGGPRCVRLPLKNDQDYGRFQALIHLKAAALRGKKPAKAAKKEGAEAIPVA